jgi:hypothetical protein
MPFFQSISGDTSPVAPQNLIRSEFSRKSRRLRRGEQLPQKRLPRRGAGCQKRQVGSIRQRFVGLIGWPNRSFGPTYAGDIKALNLKTLNFSPLSEFWHSSLGVPRESLPRSSVWMRFLLATAGKKPHALRVARKMDLAMKRLGIPMPPAPKTERENAYTTSIALRGVRCRVSGSVSGIQSN